MRQMHIVTKHVACTSGRMVQLSETPQVACTKYYAGDAKAYAECLARLSR